MGICETTKNQTEQNENIGITETMESIQIKEQINPNEATDISEEECITNNSQDFEKIDSNSSKVSKSICKIINETKKESLLGIKVSTGFLLKILVVEDYFYCLMSDENVITEDAIKNKNIINISYENGFKILDIQLDEKERYIKSFKNNCLDITVVQITDKDNISQDYFLEPQLDINNNTLIYSQIYIPQFPIDQKFKTFKGIIIPINEYVFKHSAKTDQDLSGSPIFLENNIKVIGIYKGSNEKGTEDYAYFIYPVINEVKSDLNIKSNNGKYVNGKYIWEDGKYYLGQFKNGIPHGKGIKYDSNGKILYEGYFINGKCEGKGIFW